MKDSEFTKCPMCDGSLVFLTVLDHPKHGKLEGIPHHRCQQCGEVFLSGEACDLIDELIGTNATA